MARPTIHAARVVKSVTDTQEETIVGPSATSAAPDPRRRFWAVPLAAIGFLALIGIVVSAFLIRSSAVSSIKRPYALVPSDAQQVESRLQLDGVDRYPAHGKILFVTIRQPDLPLLSWLMFRDDNEIDPHTYTELFGDKTRQQVQTIGRQQMITAKQAAEYAALTKLGYPIELVPGAIVVDQIVCLQANADQTACEKEPPAGQVLKPNDELVSVDGKDIELVDDLAAILAQHKPGDTVEVTFKRPGVDEVQTGQVELIASPDEPERTIIGFVPLDTRTIGAPPFDINIDTEGIGGPSAGLAFTLTLIDELTPGDLTGGKNIAVTGEIDVNGNVGAIGGLPQKASAVRQTGTKYFIVPASQSKESLEKAREVVEGEVEIIPVKTLDEALDVLARLGGNAHDLGQPGKDFTPPS
jgi:Lon-like protease